MERPTCQMHQPEAWVPSCPPWGQHTPQCEAPSVSQEPMPSPQYASRWSFWFMNPWRREPPHFLIHSFHINLKALKCPSLSAHHSLIFLPFLGYQTRSRTTLTLNRRSFKLEETFELLQVIVNREATVLRLYILTNTLLRNCWPLNHKGFQGADLSSVENLYVFDSQFSLYLVPPNLWFCIHGFNQFQLCRTVCSIYYWKTFACKWTHTLQTHVFQGSTV